MTDLSVVEREAMGLLGEAEKAIYAARRGKDELTTRQECLIVLRVACEYSKQREEKLRKALREIDLMAGVMDGSTADSGWAEVGRTAVGLARAALAENGDSDA